MEIRGSSDPGNPIGKLANTNTRARVKEYCGNCCGVSTNPSCKLPAWGFLGQAHLIYNIFKFKMP